MESKKKKVVKIKKKVVKGALASKKKVKVDVPVTDEEKEMKGYIEAKNLLTPILKMITKITVEGSENIPKKGAYILIANHRSDLDPLVIGTKFERPIVWIAAKYMFNVPIIGDFFRKVNCIPISKDKEDIELAFEKSKEAINSGKILGIFPEGWDYIADGRFNKPMGRFHTGFARLALSTGAGILPLALIPVESFIDKMPFPKWMREIWKWPEKMQHALNRLAYKKVHLKVGKFVQFDKEPNPSYDKLNLICTKMRNVLSRMVSDYESHSLIEE